MLDWSRIGSFFDFGAVYFTTQLLRCAMISYAVAGVVMLGRTLFYKKIFFKGMLWALFLPTLFLGRLKMFYENKLVFQATWRLTSAAMNWIWVDRLYMAGIVVAAVCIFGKRFRVYRFVAGLDAVFLEGASVRVTDMNVTPFTVGLIRHKIVLPKIMLERCSHKELRMVIEHERTHIRLLHLWYALAWDALRCLFWVNPFFTIYQKEFRSDMEDICDRVCIQNSGQAAHTYGLFLLKALRLLRFERVELPTVAAYAGEREFTEIKKRMEKIAGFCPYRKGTCVGMAAAAAFLLAFLFFGIQANSYARCNETEEITIGSFDGETKIVSYDTKKLRQMISYDDRYVYVDQKPFDDFLRQKNAKGDIWIVFGGFYKLPGIGGAADACIYENSFSGGDLYERFYEKNGRLRIPYDSIRENWEIKLLKWL